MLQLQRVKAELHKQLCTFNLFQPTRKFLPSILFGYSVVTTMRTSLLIRRKYMLQIGMLCNYFLDLMLRWRQVNSSLPIPIFYLPSPIIAYQFVFLCGETFLSIMETII